jgi:hypothetical protein
MEGHNEENRIQFAGLVYTYELRLCFLVSSSMLFARIFFKRRALEFASGSLVQLSIPYIH